MQLHPHNSFDAGCLSRKIATLTPHCFTAGKADVGPVLVVCYTNHALDSFLEDILESGVTKSLVRVVRVIVHALHLHSTCLEWWAVQMGIPT